MNANEIDSGACLRAAGRMRAVAASFATLLVVLAGLAGAGRVSAREAAAGHALTILVLPFDLYDFSLDHRPSTVKPLHRWVSRLAGQVAGNVSGGVSLRALGGAKAVAALRKVREDYPHATACRSCMLSIARKAGADVVVIGQVHKLSNLITYFDVDIDDVRSGRVLRSLYMRADGAYTDSMWKHIAKNLARRVEHTVAGRR